MYKKDQEDIYYAHKFILSLMFDNSQTLYKTVPWLYDIDVLSVLKDLVEAYSTEECLAHNVKTNIYTILVDGRNINDENYKERIELINKIINILNNTKDDKVMLFYSGQAYIRRNNLREIKKWSFDKLKREIPYIEQSICNDFDLVCSHIENTTEEEFNDYYLPIFTNNNYYYESLNTILRECPSLFKNKLFAKRVKQVLSVNKNMPKNYVPTHRKVKRLVKKSSK